MPVTLARRTVPRAILITTVLGGSETDVGLIASAQAVGGLIAGLAGARIGQGRARIQEALLAREAVVTAEELARVLVEERVDGAWVAYGWERNGR